MKARIITCLLNRVFLPAVLAACFSHAVSANENERKPEITCGEFGDTEVRLDNFTKSNKYHKTTLSIPIKGSIYKVSIKKGRPFIGTPLFNCIVFRKVNNGKYVNHNLANKRYNGILETKKRKNKVATYGKIDLYSYKNMDKYSDTFYGSGNFGRIRYSLRCSNIGISRFCDGLAINEGNNEDVMEFAIYINDLIYLKNFLQQPLIKILMKW